MGPVALKKWCVNGVHFRYDVFVKTFSTESEMDKYELARALEELITHTSGAVRTTLQQALELVVAPTDAGITDTQAKRHSKGRLIDKQCRGLLLECSPRFGKQWRVRSRKDGKDVVVTLGSFEDMDVAAARRAWADWKDHGIEPAITLKKKKAAKREGDLLLSKLVDRFCTEYSDKYKSAASAKGDRSNLGKFVTLVGDRHASSLTVDTARDALLEIKTSRGEQAANATRSALSKMHTVGTGRDSRLQLASKDLWLPVDTPNWGGSVKFGKPKKQYPLDDAELRAFVSNLESTKMPPVIKRILWFCLMTGVRVDEAVGLRREHVHLEDRFARVPETKNREPLEIQLSDVALPLVKESLEDQTTPWVFPNTKSGTRFDTATVQKKLADNRSALGVDRHGKDLEVRKHVTPHSLRRTVGTWLRKRGYPKDVRDAVMNHASQGGVDDLYTHTATHQEAAKAALQAWGEHLDLMRMLS